MNVSKYIGLPYSKLDCFALVRLVGSELFGANYPVLEEHSPTPRLVTHNELQKPNWIHIDWNDRKPGDVVALSPNPGPAPHVGILVSNDYVLHSDKKFGVVLQNVAALRRRGYIYRKVYRWVEFQ